MIVTCILLAVVSFACGHACGTWRVKRQWRRREEDRTKIIRALTSDDWGSPPRVNALADYVRGN